MRLLKRLFLFVLFIGLVGSKAFAMEYAHTLKDGPMSFSWSVDGEMLHVKLSGRTTGWVGVGFNPAKMMKGANFIMGYVKKGKVKVTDHVGNTERNHKADTKSGGTNNATNISGQEKKGMTEISFSMPLNSGETVDTPIDPDGMTTVLLGQGGGRDSFRSVHSFKSVHKITLSSGTSEKVK